jgi:mannose-6-phosphate isomerase-like protein (cupin superfamily)
VCKVYSKVNPELVTHVVIGKKIDPSSLETSYDLSHPYAKRVDVLATDELLQFAYISMEAKESFKPHIHNPFPRKSMTRNTQESWIILQGDILVMLYDIDQKCLGTITITSGDSIITLHGGHNYKCKSRTAEIYEIKNGPYFPDLDKHRF